MELNIKLLSNGSNFYLNLKLLELKGEKLGYDQMEKLCARLTDMFHVGAVPYTTIEKQFV